MSGAWNRVARGNFFPNTFSISANSRTASKEWPPSSKKLSLMPIGLTPKTASQTFASCNSIASRGAKNPLSRSTLLSSGSGKALRSTFPLGVSGSVSRNTNPAGIIYSGTLERKNAFRSELVAAAALATTYPTRRLSPEIQRSTTTAC